MLACGKNTPGSIGSIKNIQKNEVQVEAFCWFYSQ